MAEPTGQASAAKACSGELILSKPDVGKSSTITVGPSGDDLTIQAAITAAAPGDTIIVSGGTYYEHVLVDKNVTIKAATGETPIVDGSKSGTVFQVTASGATVDGFTIRNAGSSYTGIIVTASGTTIVNNNIAGGQYGIYVQTGSHNVIRGNTVDGATVDGIHVENSNYDTIQGNSLLNNGYGIEMYNTDGTVASDNYFKGNKEIEFYNEQLANVIIRNNVFAYSGYTGNGDTDVDGYGQRYCNNVTIEGNTIDSHYYGLKVYYSNNIKVINNIVKDSGANIRIDFGTHDSVVRGNTVSGAINNILIMGSTYHILIEDNTAFNGREGIYLANNFDNTVKGNEVYGNTYGVRLENSTDNVVTGSYTHGNTVGLKVQTNSNRNKIYLNDFTDSKDVTGTNKFYSDDCYAYTYHSTPNVNYLGNYWSAYTGQDANGDGVGDSAYDPSLANDRYPLVERVNNYAIQGTATPTPTPSPSPSPSPSPTATPVPSGTITVGPTGNYKTIQAAINAAKAGNTILVSTGTYKEALTVSKTLTIKADTGASPTIDCTGISKNAVTITASGVRFEGFTIQNIGSGYYGILVSKGSSSTIISNKITGGSAGICLTSNSNTVKNNDLSGATCGISISGATKNLLTGNSVHDNSYGIRLDSSKSNTIYLNDIMGNTISASQTVTTNAWTSDTITYQYKGKTYSGKLGNKYSDYTGADNNGDGIGDIAYKNSYKVTDTAPLMELHINYIV